MIDLDQSRSLRRVGALVLLVLVLPALAQPPRPLGPNEGQVLEIDRAAGEITLQHGYLPELSMEPMAMVFAVADRALLDRVKPGDRVVLKAGLVNGRFGILAIEAVKPKPK